MFVEKKSQNVIREKLLTELLDTEKVEIPDEWVTADIWSPNPDYPKWDDKRKFTINYTDRIYAGRNYFLFGILAKVRWYECPKPISNPKGFPDNACEEVKLEYSGWGSDAHSASYFTLTELLNYDWSFWDEYDLDHGIKGSSELVDFRYTMERMKKISDNPDNVRIVFWFDN
jgi:hypothetical protein